MGFLLVFAFLLALVHCVSSEQDAPGCDIDCYDDTVCKVGESNFSEHPTAPNGDPLFFHKFNTSDGGFYCDCPLGKTGLRCGRHYESCDDSGIRCYHHGKCIEGQVDEFSNEQYFCDCNNATDQNGTHYIGKYCEVPAQFEEGSTDPNKDSVTKCDPDGVYFCVNGRPCKPDFKDHTHLPCECGPDLEGPHCEFAAGSVPDCTLECESGGYCKLGIKSYEQASLGYNMFWDTEVNSMHCECKDGFFGPRCEVSSEVCNDHHCFHGAKCLDVPQPDGTDNQYCDCTTAEPELHRFGGQYCQYKATSFCDSDTEEENGQAVCYNGGICNNDGPHGGCTCSGGFHGPRCEFHDSFIPEGTGFANCTLDCDNQGECRKGVKDTGVFRQYGVALAHLANQTHTPVFEHCVCPEGYGGVDCSVEIQTCGEHICLHGSTCKVEDGKHVCDCDDAHNGLDSFAGIYCQHKSTAICTHDGKLGLGKNSLAFCVNGGTCKGLTEDHNDRDHPGCDCPDQFEGPHCEFIKGSQSATAPAPSPSGGGKKKGAIAFGVIAGLVVVVLAGVIYYRVRRNNIEQTGPAMEGGVEKAAGPVVDVGPEKDFDGNELENVEII